MTEIKPKYQFVEAIEGEEEVSPIKRSISKTMEITENFTVFAALEYVAKIDKAIKDKEAEIEGFKIMKKAYEDEFKLIEEELGVQEMEADYQKEVAKKNQEETEAALKAELLKTGNFVEKE